VPQEIDMLTCFIRFYSGDACLPSHNHLANHLERAEISDDLGTMAGQQFLSSRVVTLESESLLDISIGGAERSQFVHHLKMREGALDDGPG
jgi:hypothetical protein